MEQKIPTSFIPKSSGGRTIKARRPFSFFIWLISAVFILSVTSSVLMFFYERFLLSQHEVKKSAIQNEISAFEPELTRELTAVKNRIDTGRQLLQNHISASSFFLLLESLTVRNVFFTDLSLDTSLGSWATLKAKGEASSYAVLAFQANTLRQSDFVRNTKFYDVNLNEQGRVVFSLDAEIDPRLVLYSSLFPVEPENQSILEEVRVEPDLDETDSEELEP